MVPPETPRGKAARLLPALLPLLVLAVYLRTGWNGFIPYFDDDVYLTSNPVVQEGLTARGVAWAFSTFQAANWHPLTWLSHMADVSLFGAGRAGAHHLASAALHGINVLLFHAFLRRSTGAPLPSLLAAALFAVHPAHVESVAWLSERKDLLCALFLLLSLHAYRRYAAAPSAGRYGLTVLPFALSLLSKPMAVTLPFGLLLLDAWPLGRTALCPPADGSPHRPVPYRRLLLEKAPLLLLSAASSAVTLAAQGGALLPPEYLPPGQRVATAVVSVLEYVRILLFPAGLAHYYPLPPPPGIAPWKAVAAGAALAALTALAVREGRRRPFLAVGWLWFLGTLVPVIGLVKVGGHAMADRYAYLPFLGLYAAAAFGLAEAARKVPRGERVLAAAGCAAVVALAAVAFRQAGYWRDTETLFRRTIAATGVNVQIRNQLGAWYLHGGREEEALAQFVAAARDVPDHYPANLNAGEVFLRRRDGAAALPHLLAAARSEPGDPRAALGAAEALELLGRREEAALWFRRVLSLDPRDGDAREGLRRLGEAPGGGSAGP